MWIYASAVAAKFQRDLADLLDELRTRAAGDPVVALDRASEWGDVDYTFGGSIRVTRESVTPGRTVTVRPHVWFASHPLVPGRPAERRLDPDFYGTDDVTWLLCHQVGGRQLSVGPEGPQFVVDLAGSREAQQAALPSAEALAAWRAQRCECAEGADGDPRCEGPRDLIRVLGGDVALHGCYSHAVDALRRHPWTEAQPGTAPGYRAAALQARAHGAAKLAGPRRRDAVPDGPLEPVQVPPPGGRDGDAGSSWWRRLRRSSR